MTVCTVGKSSQQFVLCVIYRPPSTTINEFLMQLQKCLETLNSHDMLIVVGDFNIEVSSHSSATTRLLNLMNDFDLLQFVTSPTHDSGHTIDLVFARKDCRIISNLFITPGCADHACILFELTNSSRKDNGVSTKQFQSFKQVDHDELSNYFYSTSPTKVTKPSSH
jgi:endonuclease/exonuclease/phosphatase (EEP) superfamily protein YafD